MRDKALAPHTAVVEKLILCSMSGDLEGAKACIHATNIFHEAANLPYPGEFVGHAGFIRLLTTMNSVFEAAIEDYELIDDGTRVVARMQLALKSRISGRSLRTPVVELYSFTEGQISSVDIFYKDGQAVSDLAAGR